jgi:hypothetical protein
MKIWMRRELKPPPPVPQLRSGGFAVYAGAVSTWPARLSRSTSPWRTLSRVFPAAAGPEEEERREAAETAAVDRDGRRPRPRGLDWAGLLCKTFAVDVFTCPRCGDQRRVLAYLTQGAVIGRILRHLHLPELPPPLAQARGPPQQALCR